MHSSGKCIAPAWPLIFSYKNSYSFNLLTHHIHGHQDESASRLWRIISAHHQQADTGYNKISRAEELLQACKWPEPSIYPLLVLRYVQEAQAIFELHRMPDRVVSCRIAAAFIHCQLGEERNAIALATAAMANPALLQPESMACATYVRALAHSRLGELDTALQLIEGKDHDFALMAPGITPWLSALINWARAQILWKIYLYKNHQNLWCGPPPDSGLVQLGAAAPDSADLQALLERVGRQLPTGLAWPYSDLLQLSVKGLDAGRREAAGVIRAIERIGVRHQIKNPPIAGWAWLSSALVHCSKRQYAQALQAVMLAKSTAQTYQLEGLCRNALVYEYHIQETAGRFCRRPVHAEGAEHHAAQEHGHQPLSGEIQIHGHGRGTAARSGTRLCQARPPIHTRKPGQETTDPDHCRPLPRQPAHIGGFLSQQPVVQHR